MAVPYFNAHSLNPVAQKAYDLAVSNSGSVLHGCPQHRGVVFGLEVQQAAPNNYLNTSNPYGERFHNPFSDYRFPKVLVRVLYHQAPGQSDENILYTGQSGLRIDRAWSTAVGANSQLHSINADHSPLDSTLKGTVGNGSSGTGRLTPQISSVVDNTSQKAYLESETRKASRKAYEQSETRKASRRAYEQSEARKASRRAYEQSVKGKASRKAYRQSDNSRAYQKAYQRDYQKAYRQSEAGKASRKSYIQSDKGKAASKAYRQSDKSKAYQKAYHQSAEWKAYQKAYQKAYYEVFNKTGDKEQAKIAGKQAAALMKKSNKKKNS